MTGHKVEVNLPWGDRVEVNPDMVSGVQTVHILVSRGGKYEAQVQVVDPEHRQELALAICPELATVPHLIETVREALKEKPDDKT